jgi:hypothetical protein
MSGGRGITMAFFVAAIAALSLLAAGCGGGGASVASVASTTTVARTTTPNGLLAFSTCMRFVGGNVKLTIHQASTSSPQFHAALNACNHLLPTDGGGSQQTAEQLRTQIADGLSFARCVRSHGVARFPDPTAQGQLPVERVQAQGIDVHSPAVLRAVQVCLPASHGLLTPAKVRAALSRAGG